MNNIYNTTTEIKLRILMVLENSIKSSMTLDEIVAIDFITIYGKEFHVSSNNLHGDSRYKYSELPSRRHMANLSINELVKAGLITVHLEEGFTYSINDNGINYIELFGCSYVLEYKKIVLKSFELYGDIDAQELMRNIQKKSQIKGGR